VLGCGHAPSALPEIEVRSKWEVEQREEPKADEVSREIPAVASLSDVACGQAWEVRCSGLRPRGEGESPGGHKHYPESAMGTEGRTPQATSINNELKPEAAP
jgi:hypothetical protein